MTLVEALKVLTVDGASQTKRIAAVAVVAVALRRLSGSRRPADSTARDDAEQEVSLALWAGEVSPFRGTSEASARAFMRVLLQRAIADQFRGWKPQQLDEDWLTDKGHVPTPREIEDLRTRLEQLLLTAERERLKAKRPAGRTRSEKLREFLRQQFGVEPCPRSNSEDQARHVRRQALLEAQAIELEVREEDDLDRLVRTIIIARCPGDH